MSEQSPSSHDQDRIKAAQALYGAINSAFEDWESREIPPRGYDAVFSYDLPASTIARVQYDPDFSLQQLGIHDLRAPARWDVGIAVQPSLGRLSLAGVSMPLATPGQRLLFSYESIHDDTFAVYLKDQDRLDVLPSSQHPALVDSSYVKELLAATGIEMPDLNVSPAERTLALAQIANQATLFEIVQRKSLPVHPTQEIVFEKITSRSEPKQASEIPTSKQYRSAASRQTPPQLPTYETTLRAIYTETRPEGTPLYQQVVTFEGSGAMMTSHPRVELFVYEVNELTGDITRQRAATDEQISPELIAVIESGLFEANYGGEDPQPGGY